MRAGHRLLQAARRIQRPLIARPSARARGIVAASAGNHGLGIAYAARALGISATIYIPSTAPAVKRDGIVALGAKVDATAPRLR